MAHRAEESGTAWREAEADVKPMLAELSDEARTPLVDARRAHEPKYDGIRALVSVEPGHDAPRIRIRTRLGHDKTTQFPEIVAALRERANALTGSILLDGEIVAVGPHGTFLGFPALQPRLNLTRATDVAAARRERPVVFVAFDLLREGKHDLRPLPLTTRRERLERLFALLASPAVRASEYVVGDGRALYARARRQRGHRAAGEGVVAKRLASPYHGGRSSDWQKLKVVERQACLVGGWTEHRGTTTRSLLLGIYDAGRLTYIGHTVVHAGEPRELWSKLARLETDMTPFAEPPLGTKTPPHWVRPEVVVEIDHDGWADGTLRHPATFVGPREDVYARTVHRETPPPQPSVGARTATVSTWTPPPATRGRLDPPAKPVAALLGELETIESGRGTGSVTLPDGFVLAVTDLGRAVWPKLRLTKGDLLRYYVRITPLVLPALADRPLGARYFPQGVGRPAFFQQRAPASVPAGVRVELLDIDTPVKRRLVGGSLLTLLYLVDAGAVSHDPWLSRVGSLDFPDWSVFDLDPMPGCSFARVRDVARWIRDALGRLGVAGVPKTSGASGLHIYVPLAPQTTYETSRIFCHTIASHVAAEHPEIATVERTIARRGARVYVDCLQNLRAKTLASAYSARANAFAGVSTPLRWEEIDERLDPHDFTVRTVLDRLRAVGDLWAAVRETAGVDLAAFVAAPPARARRRSA